MANTRTNMPQLNLKDRIAALQQRTASPPQNNGQDAVGNGTAATPGRLGVGSSLKDKIASFEKKGAVPTPKGRFGEGTLMTGDTSSKRRGELYGNRVPELTKSTAEAVLMERKRTVSTHTARSYSISKPLVPTLTGNVPPLPPLQPQRTGDWAGFSEPRYPSTADHSDRRTVSDVLPRTTTTFSDVEVEEPLMENEETTGGDHMPTEKQLDEHTSSLPVVVEPVSISAPEPARRLDEPAAEVLVSADIPQESSAEGVPVSASQQEQEIKPASSAPVVSQPSSPIPAVAEGDKIPTPPTEAPATLTAIIPLDTPAPTPSLTTVEDTPSPLSPPLSLNTETKSFTPDADKSIDDSEKLQTPSDNGSFQTAESPVNARAMDSIEVSGAQGVAPMKEAPKSLPNTAARDVATSVASSRPTPLVSSTPAVAPESPLDHPSDSPVTPQTATPRTAKPRTPPPAVSSHHSVPATNPAPSSPSEKAMLEQKSAQKSFHAVVHRKVVESSPVEAPIVQPAPRKANPSFPPQKAPVRKVVSQAYVEPASPSLGDLASLVADAALLEEALATPVKKSNRPSTKAHSALQDVRESRSLERPRPTEIRVEGVQYDPSAPPENSPFSDTKTAANSTSFFSTHLRANSTNGRQSTSPSPSRNSQGPKYFPGIRIRKQSMPGAYPRSSVCSDVTIDDTVLVASPPSPPSHYQEGSDTSSIISSSKSWKSPKKSLGRASSWLFKGKSRSPSVAEEDERPLPPLPEPGSPSPSALLAPRLDLTAGAPILPRPASWVSISSAGSGDVFDSELFDSFPSVPGSVPPHPTQLQAPVEHRGNLKTRPHTIAGKPSRR
ncbi:hypothetical protein BDW22DRAFT_1418424 [Trametopsis cervina]|nr:hypothetical protein BDW22DRAFT_1418424 [Trametopsis cervina]